MTTEPTTPLGKAIRRLRRERNLSQQELADRLGMTNASVSQFERGVTIPSVYTLAEVAAVLDVTYGVLFGEPLALAEHAVAQVRAEVRALGYDLALIPREEASSTCCTPDDLENQALRPCDDCPLPTRCTCRDEPDPTCRVHRLPPSRGPRGEWGDYPLSETYPGSGIYE